MVPEERTVSVVIVSWNAKRYLAQCLESLSAERCKPSMEIVVVDNDSTDGSPEYVEKHHPKVRLVRNRSNLGFAKANNIGIREAAGKYVCLLNSDVKVLADCVAKLVNFCEAHPEVGMVGPRIMGGDGKLQRSCRGFPGLWNMLCRALSLDGLFPRCKPFGGYLRRYQDYGKLAPADILSGCFWMIRREALKDVGLLDESFFMYGEDMDWCKRFWEAGWGIFYVPQAEAIHYGGASSANAPVRFFIEKQRADLQYWRKHHGRLARGCYFLISCLYHLLRIIGHAGAACLRKHRAQAHRFKMKRSWCCLCWMVAPRANSWSNGLEATAK